MEDDDLVSICEIVGGSFVSDTCAYASDLAPSTVAATAVTSPSVMTMAPAPPPPASAVSQDPIPAVTAAERAQNDALALLAPTPAPSQPNWPLRIAVGLGIYWLLKGK